MINSAIFLNKFLSKFNIEKNICLAPFSTLKVGGMAKFFIIPKKTQEIIDINLACFEYGIPIHILSGGSNTLFSDEGFDGMVIKLGNDFDYIKLASDYRSMMVGSATPLAKVIKTAIKYGWEIAPGLSGIPGLIGGAAVMNAGTKWGEMSNVISLVNGVQYDKEISIAKSEINFSYRQTSLPKDLIVTEVELSITKDSIKPVAEILAKVQEYRKQRRLTQPVKKSLGSFFQNPYPLFAGQLIEKCNLKGLSYNDAQISTLHANFIINNGHACALDILYIAKLAQKRVYEQYAIALKPEVRLLGKFPDEFYLINNNK